MVLDLVAGSVDYIERSGIPKNGLVFNVTLNDIQKAYDGGCSLIEPIVFDWLWWDRAGLSKWKGRADDILLFANIENSVVDLENDQGNIIDFEKNTRDLTEVQGFCLWDKVAKERVDKVLAGDFHVFTTAGAW